jgi:peroxiredoxin
MTMKRNLYLLLALLAAGFSGCDNEPKFKVEGAVADADKQTLYFEASAVGGVELLDSAVLHGDGSFSFKGKRPESPEFYRLRLGNKIINFAVDSTETVSVRAAAADFATGYTIEGSENNTKIKELVLLQSALQQRVLSLAQAGLPVGVAQDSLVAMVNSYKDQVKHEYIYAAPNTSYAYFALFQTLNGYQIFDPLSSREDVKCFAAVATSLNNNYPHADRSRNLYNMVIKGMKNTRTPQRRQLEVSDDVVKETGVIDIALKDLHGNTRKVTDLKGKVVLIDFTVYNNAMSATHNLLLRDLYNKYASQGLEIYQVSLDGDEHFWKTSADNLPWVCVRDEAGAYSQYVQLYNVTQLPSVFLVNRQNELSARGETIKDLDAAVQKLL